MYEDSLDVVQKAVSPRRESAAHTPEMVPQIKDDDSAIPDECKSEKSIDAEDEHIPLDYDESEVIREIDMENSSTQLSPTDVVISGETNEVCWLVDIL